jgi:hypothetical protein
MNTAVAPSTPLSAVDRCDRCGDLLFCAHHAREHGDKIREVAVTVQDETGKLAATPGSTGA